MDRVYDITKLFDIPVKGKALSLEQFDSIYLFELFGIPFNVTIVSTWIVMAVLVLLSWLATRQMRVANKVSRLQTLLEMVVSWLEGEIKETSGDSPVKYMGLGLALFMFVLQFHHKALVGVPRRSATHPWLLCFVIFTCCRY